MPDDLPGILCVLGPWALLIGYVVVATARTRGFGGGGGRGGGGSRFSIRHSRGRNDPMGQYPYQPQHQQHVHVHQPGVSALGLAGIILGIFALLVAWIPLCGVVAYPVALVGLVLAVVGLFSAGGSGQRGIAAPLTGVILNVVAFILPWALPLLFAVLGIGAVGTAAAVGPLPAPVATQPASRPVMPPMTRPVPPRPRPLPVLPPTRPATRPAGR